jgi:hypothetical protein
LLFPAGSIIKPPGPSNICVNHFGAWLGTYSLEVGILKQEFSLKQYLHDAARILRQHESERVRGNLEALEQIEHTPDAILLRKWGWISTLVGAVLSFFIMPCFLGILQHMVPPLVAGLLWALTKVFMGLSLLMMAASIYFTIGLSDS